MLTQREGSRLAGMLGRWAVGLVLATGTVACGDGGPAGGVGVVSVGDVVEPNADEVVAQMLAAQDQPTRTVFEMTSDYEMTPEGGPTVKWSVTMSGQSWADGPERTRTEMDMAFDFELPSDMSDALEGAPEDLLPDGLSMTMVRNGTTISQYMGQLDTYWTAEAHELGEIGNPDAAMAMMTDWIRDIVDGYEFTYQGRGVDGGRDTYVISGRPKADAEPPTLLGVMSFGDLLLRVDAENWAILGMDADFTMSLGDMAAARGGTEGRVIPEITGRMVLKTTGVAYDEEMADSLFEFVPPEGATQVDLSEMALLSPSGGSSGLGLETGSETGLETGSATGSETGSETGSATGSATDSVDLPGETDDPGTVDMRGGLPEMVASLADAATFVDFPILTLDDMPGGCHEVAVSFAPLMSDTHEPDAYVVAELDCAAGALVVQQSPADAKPPLAVSELAGMLGFGASAQESDGGLEVVELEIGGTDVVLMADGWDTMDLIAASDQVAAASK